MQTASQNDFLLFKNGKFKECFQCLSADDLDDRPGDSLKPFDPIEKWRKENNKLAAKYMMLKTGSIGENEVNKIVNSLQGILMQLQALPPKLSILPIELCIAYNIGCIKLAAVRGLDRSLLLQETEERIFQVLHRITNTPKSDLADGKESLVILVRHIVQSRRYKTPEITLHLSQLCALIGLLWMLDGHASKTIELLNMVLTWLNKSKFSMDLGVKEKQDLVTLPLTLSSNYGHSAKVQDTISLLLGCCYLTLGNLQECTDLLEKINSGDLATVALYMKAFAQYQASDNHKCLDTLYSLHQRTDLTSHQLAMAANLQGCCLAKQGKPHSAIHQFKLAVQHDASYHIAIYNMSLQYRKLGLVETELDLLRLLSSMLQHVPDVKAQGLTWTVDIGEVCLDRLCKQDISLPEILYILAKKLWELNRFDQASDTYLDLLAVLCRGQKPLASSSKITVPSLLQIYHEAIYCLIQAQRHEDAIIICDRAIEKFSSNSSLHAKRQYSDSQGNELGSSFIEHSVFESGTSRDIMNNIGEIHTVASELLSPTDDAIQIPPSKKRLRSPEHSAVNANNIDKLLIAETSTFKNFLLSQDVDVTALMFKVDALTKLGKYKDALDTLESVLHCLEDITVPEALRPCESASEKPHQKKLRLNSKGHCAPVEVSEHDDETSPLEHQLALFKSQILNNKAMLLVAQEKHQHALHWLRLSIQFNSENQEAYYNYTLLLVKLNRLEEGYSSWLAFRGLDNKLDGFQIEKLIKKKQSEIRLANQESDDSDDKLRLDVAALENLQKQRQQTNVRWL